MSGKKPFLTSLDMKELPPPERPPPPAPNEAPFVPFRRSQVPPAIPDRPRRRSQVTIPDPVSDQPPALPTRGARRTEVQGFTFKDGTTRPLVLENFIVFEPNNLRRFQSVTPPSGITPAGIRKFESAVAKAYPFGKKKAVAFFGGVSESCKMVPAAKFARPETIPPNDINRVKYTDVAFDLVVRKIPKEQTDCALYRPVIAQRFTTYDATAVQLASMQVVSQTSIYKINTKFALFRNQDAEFSIYKNAKTGESGELVRYVMTANQQVPLSTSQDHGYVFTLNVQPTVGASNNFIPPFNAEARIFPLPKVSQGQSYTLVLTNEIALNASGGITPKVLPTRLIRVGIRLVQEKTVGGVDMVIDRIDVYFPYLTKSIMFGTGGDGDAGSTKKKKKKKRLLGRSDVV